MSGRNITKEKKATAPKKKPSTVRPRPNRNLPSPGAKNPSDSLDEIGDPSDPDLGSSLLDFPEDPLGFLLSFRWIPEKPDHGKIYWHLNYAFTDRLRAGVDYRSITGDVSLQANYRLLSEGTEWWRPAVILGTANDDFGDISSQHYSATISKHAFEYRGWNVSPYVGAAYIQELGELRPVGGLHVAKGKLSAIFAYSGTDEHLTVSYTEGRHTLSFVLFDLDMPGLAYGWNF